MIALRSSGTATTVVVLVLAAVIPGCGKSSTQAETPSSRSTGDEVESLVDSYLQGALRADTRALEKLFVDPGRAASVLNCDHENASKRFREETLALAAITDSVKEGEIAAYSQVTVEKKGAEELLLQPGDPWERVGGELLRTCRARAPIRLVRRRVAWVETASDGARAEADGDLWFVSIDGGELRFLKGPRLTYFPPLHTAVMRGDAERIGRLLSSGTDVNARETANGQTALFVAAGRNNAEAAKLLLAAGADVTIEDLSGKTALDWANIMESKDVIPLLQAANRE